MELCPPSRCRSSWLCGTSCLSLGINNAPHKNWLPWRSLSRSGRIRTGSSRRGSGSVVKGRNCSRLITTVASPYSRGRSIVSSTSIPTSSERRSMLLRGRIRSWGNCCYIMSSGNWTGSVSYRGRWSMMIVRSYRGSRRNWLVLNPSLLCWTRISRILLCCIRSRPCKISTS